VGFDNAGTESVGEERVALNIVARSLGGYRDRLIAAGMFTDGSRTGSLLFDLPVSRQGKRVGVGLDASEIEIVKGPLAQADVAGMASTLSLQRTHPFVASPALRLDGALIYRARHSSTDFFAIEIADITVRSLYYTPVNGASVQLAWSFPIGFRDAGEDYRCMFLVQLGLPALLDAWRW